MIRLLVVVIITVVYLGPTHAPRDNSFYREIIKGMNQDHVPIAELAVYMTKRYISPKISTLVIMEKCKYCAKQQHNFQSLLLEHFLKNFDAQMTVQLYFGDPDERPWDYNIFIVDSIWAFRELLFHFPVTMHEREFYFFIILTFYTLDLGLHDRYIRNRVMKEIFMDCSNYAVMNVVILNEYKDNSFGFFTYTRNCGQELQVHEFNRYANGSLEYDYLFPQRFFLLKNCTMHVSAHVHNPILMFNGDRKNPNHTKDVHRLSGFEGRLLAVLAEKLEFNVSLSFPMDMHDIGAHGNSTGCFGELQNGAAQLVIGAFGNNEHNRYIFSASSSYHQSPFVFVVRSDLHFGTMRHLVYPFHWSVWLLIGLTMLIGICIIRFIQHCTNSTTRVFVIGPRNYAPVCKLISILLGNPITLLPRRNFARFLLMSWMLATLILRNAYQGKMFDVLRVSRSGSLPYSIADLTQQRYMLLSRIPVQYYPRELTIVKWNLTNRYTNVQEYSGRYTTISILDTLADYNLQNWQTSRLVYVKEPIYMFQYVMYFQKHSVYKPIFERKLKQLNSAGITSYLTKQFVKLRLTNMNYRVQRLPRISNSMLSGLYKMYYILNCLAVSVFVCEMLSKRSERIRAIFEWIHRRPREDNDE